LGDTELAYPLNIIHDLGRTHLGLIHVGANFGREVDDYRKSGMPWCVLIEPLTDAFNRLRDAVRDDPNMIPVQALCSSQAQLEHELYVANDEGRSSSILSPSRYLIEAPQVDFTHSEKMVSTTVDDIVAKLVATVPGFSMTAVDILTVDVQGAELLVLEGASQTLQHMRYVCSKVSSGDLYEGDVFFEELQAFLNCHGFRSVNMNMNKHGWGDALFIK
jgi:FkbM family methyltransferase